VEKQGQLGQIASQTARHRGLTATNFWSLSRVTKAVCFFVKVSLRKWLQSRIELEILISWVQRLEIEQSDPSIFIMKDKFPPKIWPKSTEIKENLYKWRYRVQKSILVRPFVIWKRYEGPTHSWSLSRSFLGVDEVTNWFNMSHVIPCGIE
jgi:hypothetical protein